MAKCPICATDNADTQRFCGECGTPLPVTSRVTAPQPAPAAEDDETILLPTAELATGSLFAGRYQVIEELGAGGMGRVYRVLDRKVDEEIALKLIRPDVASDRRILERFSSELRLARQVVHRNVARMFDLNEEAHIPYITMEYVRGENLKRLIRKVGRLSPAQAVPLVRQICAGLEEAHRLGIVHRDLKPQNVMVDEEGRAKIMDFGLARLLTQTGRDGFGSRSGTPAYISPEQITGAASDGRTDIYSLGVLLYEMLTGRTPFRADSVDEIIDMHLRETPEEPRALDPGIPASLNALVMRCLEKDPAGRFQSADELGRALDGLAESFEPAPPPRGRRLALRIGAAAGALTVLALIAYALVGRPDTWKPWLAVLPIEGTGITDEADAGFRTGLQDGLTNRLSAISRLRVLPVPSVNSLDQAGKSVPQIGRALGARYLVRVTVDVEDRSVDARIYLYDAKKNVSPEPMTYAKEFASYSKLQDELAVLAARALGSELDAEQMKKVSRRGTDDLEAYALFLEGMKVEEAAEGEEDIRRAIGLFERAIEIDPGYALAHWGLGYSYESLYYSRRDDKDDEALEKMLDHFNRASQLDPSFNETNIGLGWYFFNTRNNAKAFESFRKALAIEPDGYIVNRDSGAFLRSIGLYRKAIRYLDRAAKLSPRDTLPLVQIAQCWLYLGRCEKALAYTGKALAIRPNDPTASVMHASALVLAGRLNEAERQIQAMERLNLRVERLPFLIDVAKALAEGGRGRPHAFREERPALSPQGTYVYLLFGMKDEALANIREGVERGFYNGMYLYSYPSLAKNPWYKVFRGDPRFEEILKRQKELYDKELKMFEKL